MCLLKVFLQRRRYGCTSTVGICCHNVESVTIIVVLQLSEWLHRSVQVVVDYGESVTAAVKSLPSRIVEVLSIVGEIHATLQDIGAAQGRKTVEVESDDEIGIICHEGSELVVDHLLVEVELVELGIFEVEIIVGIII